jgi:hypothetical protein
MTSRRAFIAAAAATAADLSQVHPTNASELYDFAAVEARLARSARHRQVFAIARVADGAPLGRCGTRSTHTKRRWARAPEPHISRPSFTAAA